MDEIKNKDKLTPFNKGAEAVAVTGAGTEAKEDKPERGWDYDDKDLAMILIAAICLLGGIILAFVGEAAGGISALLTSGVTALGALATGRKKEK